MQEWKECPSIFKVLKIKMTSNNNSKKHWFALKVFYNKVFAIEELLLKKKIKCKKKIDKYIAILRLVAYNRFYRYEGRNENEV